MGRNRLGEGETAATVRVAIPAGAPGPWSLASGPRQRPVRERLALVAGGLVYVVALAGFVLVSHQRVASQIHADFDRRLVTLAEAVVQILPRDYHDRAIAADGISQEEYQTHARRLTALAQASGAAYLWTDVRRGDAWFLTSCNITDAGSQPGTEIYYWMPYADGVSREQERALERFEPVFAEFNDRWGHFQAVFLPRLSPEGQPYLACAEFTVDHVAGAILGEDLVTLVLALGLLLASLPVFVLFLNRHRQHLARVREREAAFRTIFDQSPFPLSLNRLDDGRYLAVNRAQLDTFHPDAVSPEEVVGRDPVELGLQQDLTHIRTLAREFDRRCRLTGALLPYRGAGGEERAARMWVREVVLNGERLALVASLDVTEAERARADLATSEERLRATLDAIQEGVVVVTADGTVVRANPAGRELFAATGRALVVGTVVTRSLRPEPVDDGPSVAELMARAVAGSRAIDGGEYRLPTEGGDRLWRISAAPLVVDDGLALVIRDVTSERSLEQALQQSRKLDAIGRLAGGVAHDFNNMLAGILGASELLTVRIGKDADPDLERPLGMIRGAAERAAGLTRKLLAFARRREGRREVFDLNHVVAEAAEILRRGLDKRITLALELGAAPSAVRGEPVQLENAVLNLGINARDAMPAGGRLTIVTANRDLDHEACRRSGFDIEPGPFVAVVVSDDGTGMPPEILERIFEPFFTTKSEGKGTGLGLSAVFGTIREHGGAVTVDSRPGWGSAFTLLLPLSPEDCAVADRTPTVPYGQGRVLVVDDEPILRSIAGELLGELGYRCLEAEDGQAALDLLERDQVDLVLLDLRMPRLDGAETCRRIRQRHGELPVILCSGHADRDELGLEPAPPLLDKPYRRDQLARAVAAALSGQDDRTRPRS